MRRRLDRTRRTAARAISGVAICLSALAASLAYVIVADMIALLVEAID